MNKLNRGDNTLITSYAFARNADIVFSEVVSEEEFSEIKPKNFTPILKQNSTILYKINEFILKENSVIFTSVQLIEELFKLLNKNEEFNNIKIVCSQGDEDFSSKLIIKKPKCVSKVYSINISTKDNSLIPIPIGLSNNYSPKNLIDKDFKTTNTSDFFNSKENFLYINFQENTNRLARDTIYKFFNSKEWAKVDLPNLSLNEYKRNLENSSFVLCPWGNGFDTHRVWESLYSGAIPITINHITYGYLEDLPVIFVDNFENLSKQFLEESIQNLSKNEYNFEKLYMDYWIKEIRGKEKVGDFNQIIKHSKFAELLLKD